MHPQPHQPPVEIRLTEAETIALVQVVEDALADLAEAERRSLRRDRLVSRGYVRGQL